MRGLRSLTAALTLPSRNEEALDAARRRVDEIEPPGLAEPGRTEDPQQGVEQPAEQAAQPRPRPSEAGPWAGIGEQPGDQVPAGLPQYGQPNNDPLRRRRGAGTEASTLAVVEWRGKDCPLS